MGFYGCFFSLVVTAVFLDGVAGSEFHEKRNVGYRCFNCSLLNRVGPECALSLYDCNECLEGFDDVPVTYEARRHRKPCTKPEPIEPGVVGCTMNKDCAPGFFCFQEKFCFPCLDCRAYHRQPADVCATKIEDCGSCLPGSDENEKNVLKPCQQLTSTSSPHHSREETDHRVYMTGLIIIGVTIIFTATALVFLMFKYVHYRLNINNAIDEAPVEAPPPYTPQFPECSEQSELVCGFFKEKPEAECNARVFRQPRYNVTPCVPERVVPGQDPIEIMPYDVEEETVACPWRPYEENANNSENSFSGQLPGSSAGKTRRSDDDEDPPSKRHK